MEAELKRLVMRSPFDVRLDKPKREGEETLLYAFDARVVAHLLGAVLQPGGAPRAALRRPAARALVGRQAPGRQAPPLLGRGRFIVRLRSVAAPASWRRQERARRGAGVAKRRIRRRRRRAGRRVRRAPRGDA